MANRFPLVVDTSDSNKIKEIPSGDNLQLSGNDIVGVVNITGSGTLTIESVSATNLTVNGTSINNIAISGDYNDLINVPTNISTFTNDSNYVTSGTNISVLTNDSGYLTTIAFADITDTPTTLAEYGITDAATSTQGVKADSAVQPGSNISTFNNDAGYITLTNIQNGDLTIDVNNSGDLIGSVFGQDSTILVDAILSSVNVSGTIRGHVLPRPGAGELYDIGSAEDKFKDIHLSGQLNGNVNGNISGDGTVTIQGAGGVEFTGTVDFTGATVSGIDSISVAWDDLTGTPSAIGFSIGSTINEFSSDGTLSDASTTAVPTESAVKTYVDTAISSFDSVGNFSFANSIMTTDDSSSIAIVPAVVMNSDLTVQNNLIVDGNITSTAAGDPEIVSETDILLTAVDRVTISQSPLKLASFTSTERDALTAENGDTIYNTTTNKFQGYANGAWVDLH